MIMVVGEEVATNAIIAALNALSEIFNPEPQ